MTSDADPTHLRELAVTHEDHVHTAKALRGAADEIERLTGEIEEMRGNNMHLLHQLDQARTEVERLREALTLIAGESFGYECRTIAQRALEQSQGSGERRSGGQEAERPPGSEGASPQPVKGRRTPAV